MDCPKERTRIIARETMAAGRAMAKFLSKLVLHFAALAVAGGNGGI